jgi:hypothetical protein
MIDRPDPSELAHRIAEHLASRPDQAALVSACWHGYLGGLLEWGLLSPAAHGDLIALLPPLDPNPVMDIFLGSQ